jgi:sulfite exporter TauE/SafE
MCGAACAGLAQAGRAGRWQGTSPTVLFQVGRVLGYSTLGALAAASLQGIGWLTTQSTALRPLWSFFHVACLVLGLTLLVRAEQPLWLGQFARRLWSWAQRFSSGKGPLAPLAMGMLWALLPCGLLYSALMVASLTSQPLQGAAVMALFASGSSLSLLAGPWLWLRLGRQPGLNGWGMRLAGLALALSSAWALWMGLFHDTAPWCVTP